MAVFRVERNTGYTVMSNHHLRNKELSLKAKGLLSQMLSLPEDWDYTLAGLSYINREKIDAIREAVRELERAGYIQRSRERDEKGRLRGTDYIIYGTLNLTALIKMIFGFSNLIVFLKYKCYQRNLYQWNIPNRQISQKEATIKYPFVFQKKWHIVCMMNLRETK